MPVTKQGKEAAVGNIAASIFHAPEMVVNAALQEDADAIGISILSGAHMTVFPKIMQLMKAKEMDDVLVTGGGIIPEDDMKELNAIGVGKLFSPGANTKDIADYIVEWVQVHRNF